MFKTLSQQKYQKCSESVPKSVSKPSFDDFSLKMTKKFLQRPRLGDHFCRGRRRRHFFMGGGDGKPVVSCFNAGFAGGRLASYAGWRRLRWNNNLSKSRALFCDCESLKNAVLLKFMHSHSTRIMANIVTCVALIETYVTQGKQNEIHTFQKVSSLSCAFSEQKVGLIWT